jgi:hypothetical protein
MMDSVYLHICIVMERSNVRISVMRKVVVKINLWKITIRYSTILRKQHCMIVSFGLLFAPKPASPPQEDTSVTV